MRNYVIALYIRLSVEDFKTESLSIPNQKLILREKAMSLPEWDDSEILEFIDNGHTGTNFERPAVQELLTMVQAGKINCIIVKDLSRFGRNSIETGLFALNRVSIFAASDNSYEMICLIWFDGTEEPELWVYDCNGESRYKDLASYLQAYIDDDVSTSAVKWKLADM